MFSILVVEDNEVLNEMISTRLKLESYNVYSAFDGEEALNTLEHKYIDLIISDIAPYDYENENYHSELYDKGVRYFPYLAIEHYLKIEKPIFGIYLIVF